MEHAISCSQLTRRFGRTIAVNDLTIDVPAGSIFALLGPNGAGKSTCLRLWLDLIKPGKGKTTVLGTASDQLRTNHWQRIGYVAEGQDLPEWMKVDYFIGYCRSFYSRWDPELESRLRQLFELPGDRKLKNLSRGMKMKTALLSVLAYRPELLVLDEPFSGLDPIVRDELVSALLELPDQDRPATIVVSTHDLNDVERLIDHVAFLREGRLNLNEDLESLMARHRSVEITAETALPDLGSLTATWLRVEQPTPQVLRGFTTDWGGSASESSIRTALPPSAHVEIRPLSLRELYVLLAAHIQPAPTS